MDHQDAEITEVVLVLNREWEARLPEAVERLKGLGMEIFPSENQAVGVIEGSLPSYKVPQLNSLEFVNYVRTVLTYIADYPKGDPRDLDGEEE